MSASQPMVKVLAAPPVRRLLQPITRIEQTATAGLPRAKQPVPRPIKRRSNLDVESVQRRAEKLAERAANLVGQKDVTAVCLDKTAYGAFFRVTDGPAKGIEGLLHVNVLRDGERELKAIEIGDFLTLDIIRAMVKTKGGKAVIKLGFDRFAFPSPSQEPENACPSSEIC